MNAAVQHYFLNILFNDSEMGTEIHILWIILELLGLSLSGHIQQSQKQQTLHPVTQSHSIE